MWEPLTGSLDISYNLIMYLKKIHCILVQRINKEGKTMKDNTTFKGLKKMKAQKHQSEQTEKGFKKLLTVSGCHRADCKMKS